MEKIWLHDNQTIKWMYEENRYCLHIRRDGFPENPREWDPDNRLTTMACWHSRYSLGDVNATKGLDQIEFWQKLVRDNVGEEEILAAAKAGGPPLEPATLMRAWSMKGSARRAWPSTCWTT